MSFNKAAAAFVREAKIARMNLHPADIAACRDITMIAAEVSAACSALRGGMPVLIDNRFDLQRLNTDMIVHIFRFAGAKNMALVCRRFHCIYITKFVGRMVIPLSEPKHCSPFLAPLTTTDITISNGFGYSGTLKIAELHEFFLARRYAKVPKNVAEGSVLTSNGGITLRRLLIPTIDLPAETWLPLNTTYLTVVQRVCGVKHLVLMLLNYEIGYYLFPKFDGVEVLQIWYNTDHGLYGDNFHTFYRNICQLASEMSPTLKEVRLTPVLLKKFKEEAVKYPPPIKF